MPRSNVVRLRGKVLGRLGEGYITIFLGYGPGQMEGGQRVPIPIDKIPLELRMPNTVFEVILQLEPWEILRIEQVSNEEKMLWGIHPS